MQHDPISFRLSYLFNIRLETIGVVRTCVVYHVSNTLSYATPTPNMCVRELMIDVRTTYAKTHGKY